MSTTDPFAPVDAVAPGAAPLQLTPPEPDTKPKRPTTRAGRAAAAAAKKAANGERPKESKPKSQAKPTPRKADLENRLTAQLAFIGTGIAGAGAMSGSQAVAADGVLIIEHAATVSAALKNLGDQNPKVKKYLEAALGASAWGGVLAALLPLAFGIGMNHGVIAPELYAQMTGAMAMLAAQGENESEAA